LANATILPDADHVNGTYSLTGASRHAALAPTRGAGAAVTHDDDTSHLSRGSGGGTDQALVKCGDIPDGAEVLDSVDAIKVRYRNTAASGTDTARTDWDYNGTGSNSTNLSIPANTNWQTGTVSSPARPGGGSWELDNFVDGLVRAGIGQKTNLAVGWRITSVWFEVTVQLGEDTIALYASSIAAAIMGSGLFGGAVTLRDVVSFLRSRARRPRIIPSNAQELEAVTRELRRAGAVYV
jgi:hypothetical protein